MQSQRPTKRHQPPWLSALARRLLRLYPRVWRDRYGDELDALLDEYPVTLWTLLDLLLGVFDARLHINLLPGRLTSMTHRIRTSEIAIFVAFVLFCVAWFPLHFVSDTPSLWQSATQAHPELGVALTTLNLAGMLALLAVLVGGIPLLLAAFGRAVADRRWDVLLLLAIPALVALVYVGITIASVAAFGALQGPFPMTPPAIRPWLALGALVAASGSTVALAFAIGRSELGLRMARFALIAAGMATISMGVGMLAGVSLIALISVEAQEQLGVWPPIEAALTLVLLGATTLADLALWRGAQAARSGIEASSS
ncbi:MAG TPA: hypothetical protein VKQ36_08790 [Ktedonobacterales bacterium]|nr:hypothetical protein [Ktedonobacterales bacterium]